MFDHRLLEARKKKGMTQKQVAEAANIHVASYSAYESNKKVPPVDIVVRLAAALDVSLDWLCGRGEDRKNIITYGDIARLVLLIEDKLSIFANIRTYTSNEYSADIVQFVELRIEDSVLYEFFQKAERFGEMAKGSADERELYQAWLETKLRELDKMGIEDFPF